MLNSRVRDSEETSAGSLVNVIGIKSQFPIPEFFATPSSADVTIVVDRQHGFDDFLPQEVIERDSAFTIERDEAIFYFREIGLFIVRGGKTITLIPAAESSPLLTRQVLVGTIMATLLYQRGLLVLHASAVNVNGEAIAFLGQSGEGKSSMAAAFEAQGYGIITDDVAPIDLDSNIVTVAPGFPQTKLSLEVADTLGYDYDSFKLLHP